MKKFFNFLFSRIFYISLMVLMQLTLFIVLLVNFRKYYIYLFGINLIFVLISVFYIINDNINPSFKISWILISTGIPILGWAVYFIFGERRLLKAIRKRMKSISFNMNDSMDLTREYKIKNPMEYDINSYTIAKYINVSTGSPLFFNTGTEYFKSGEDSYEKYLEDLKSAKSFIFMEYFIVSEGIFLDSIINILKEKVEEGVDVRFIVDDVGSMLTLPDSKIAEFRQMGIKVVEFNPIRSILLPKHNNRTHRKMTIIDGNVAYTGGINIADEYLNLIERFGYWKDSVLRIEGPGVAAFINMFMIVWNYYSEDLIDSDVFDKYIDNKDYIDFLSIDSKLGMVIPFMESPLTESATENIYLNMIRRANKSVYITTPYLIITWEMENALISAAKSGVDVVLITPRVPDKKYAHLLTRSFYKRLVENGVKIYEYLPGFIHAKNFVCDDEYAIVGSINLDYRSLYLHFECGVWMYKTPVIEDIKRDFEETLKESELITKEWVRSRGLFTRFIQGFLKFFAPFM